MSFAQGWVQTEDCKYGHLDRGGSQAAVERVSVRVERDVWDARE